MTAEVATEEESSIKMHWKTVKRFFYIKNLDSHFYIELFNFIRLTIKHKKTFKYQPASGFGLTAEKRNPQIIVSLTSYPDRIGVVDKTVNTLLSQTMKPDKLILWLAESQFPNKEADLPEDLLKLRELGLEIGWCEDLRSYKKLIPTLQQFPNDIIVTADDDLYYQKDWLESLYSAYLKNPDCICTRRATGIFIRKNEILALPHYSNNSKVPSFSNHFTGCSGVLYPPNSLHKDIFDTEQIKTLIPTHDDIYFWAMAILNKTKIYLAKAKDLNSYTIDGTQEGGLCKQTRDASRGMLPEVAFDRIFKRYPKVYEILKEECANV